MLPIVTRVTLWTGVPRVDFSVTVENTARDHRLRALFPLPFEVEQAMTEDQFHVAERELVAPAWNGVSPEQPPTTFPQKTFAAFEGAGTGLAVFNQGLPEGELVRDPGGRQAYALTLLRCVGWLSRPDLVSRRGGAGPTISTEDSQLEGRHTFTYALTSYQGDWRSHNVQAMAHSFCYPPLAFGTNEHEGSLGPDIPLASVTAGVVPTALHRSDVDGGPIVRVYNASGEEASARIHIPPGSAGASRIDLMERVTGDVDGGDEGWRVPLRAWEIASLRFGRG